MNIVCIPRRFTPTDWGGAETVILETGTRLSGIGHRVEVMCPAALSKVGPDVVGGLQVTRFPYFYPYFGLGKEARRRLDHKGGNLFSFALMKALRTRPDLDIIHLHTGKRLGGIGRTVARTRGVPYVISLHGGVYDVPPDEARTFTEPTRGTLEWGKVLGLWVGSRRVLQDADAIICVGRPESDRAQEMFPEKRVVYIPNGVDTQRFANGDGPGFRMRHHIPARARVILTVGRIDPQKDQGFAIRFLRGIAENEPEAHLLLVGPVTNEAYMAELRDDVEKSGLRNRTTIIPGFDAGSDELVDAYHAADVFLLPSQHEPFGIVILEAWSAGLPVLATNVGGIPWFVEHGKDGLLFESGDLAGCVEAYKAISDNPDLGRDLAMAGMRKARERFSWEAVTETLADLYDEVVRAHGRAA
ncbi:MAG: glycosyltransferase family 4 protein [Deltaproteobacteria bacterium]|nr:glycosyltransferase family 4 protein [Deltaproteobacteria bacterium]